MVQTGFPKANPCLMISGGLCSVRWHVWFKSGCRQSRGEGVCARGLGMCRGSGVVRLVGRGGWEVTAGLVRRWVARGVGAAQDS